MIITALAIYFLIGTIVFAYVCLSGVLLKTLDLGTSDDMKIPMMLIMSVLIVVVWPFFVYGVANGIDKNALLENVRLRLETVRLRLKSIYLRTHNRVLRIRIAALKLKARKGKR